MKVIFQTMNGNWWCYPDDGGALMLCGTGKTKEASIADLVQRHNELWNDDVSIANVKEGKVTAL
jgi:hypothetical protein